VNAHLPHVRRNAHWTSDTPGFDTTVFISNAKTPSEAVANSVGSDTVTEKQSSPLNFSHLEEKNTRTTAPFANGYSTRYGGMIHC
jgi:hypothetical protein